MKEDTKRALEIIAPMDKELGIEVNADDTFLYCNSQASGTPGKPHRLARLRGQTA